MREKLIMVSVLGISLIISSVVFGTYFYQSRQPEKTIRVVGASTQRFGSDIIKWRITVTRTTGINDLKNGFELIKQDRKNLTEILKNNGVDEKSISIQPVNTNPVYSQYERPGNPIGYNIQQNIFVISKDVDTLERFALDPSELVEKGIMIQSSNLEYYSSRLSEIKRELLAKATKDARSRAEEIAKSSGDRISQIVSARVGVFQITEPFSTEVSDYGIYNSATREKDITVTVNVVFKLK